MTLSTKQQEFLEKSVPPLYRGYVSKALAGEGSPRQAIKAKCMDCCHFDRAEVEACGVTVCPLHAFRPRFGASHAEGRTLVVEQVELDT